MQAAVIKHFTPLIFCFLFLPAFSQENQEKGYFDVRNYSPKEYHAKTQNWSIVQDNRGVMYFGNQEGVLEYDGENWQLIRVEDRVVRSLAIDNKGVIYVGASGEFGYLKPDKHGQMQYQSLLKYLDAKDKEFVDVWKILVTGKNEVYFQASNKIFRWNGNTLKVWNADRSFHLMFYVKGSLYVRQRDIGMMKMINDQLVLLPGGDLFAGESVYFMIPYTDSRILLNTRSHGLFLMTPGSSDFFSSTGNSSQFTRVVPFSSEANNFFVNSLIYNGISLNDNSYSIGTLNAGIAVIDTSGKLQAALDKNSGLQDATVFYQYLDNEKNLWLALNNGISKIGISDPITKFSDRSGLEGTIQAIAKYKGILFVATNLGVFFLEKKSAEKSITQSSIDHGGFSRVKELNSECWDLLPFKNGEKDVLLVTTNDGVLEIDGDKVTQVCKGNATVFYRSVYDSLRVYIGLADGLCSIYREKDGWRYEGRADGINEDIRSIAEEKDGNLWLGTNNAGVFRVTIVLNNHRIDDLQATTYGKAEGLPDSAMMVQQVNGSTIFATGKGLYRFVPGAQGRKIFLPDTSFGSSFADTSRHIHRIIQDKNGKIWMVTISNDLKNPQIEIGYTHLAGNGKYEWVATPFISIAREVVHAIFPDSGGIAWLGGPDGLFRYDSRVGKSYVQEFNTLIRKVVAGRDSVIFSGAYFDENNVASLSQPEQMKMFLPYSNNSLAFLFAAPCFDDESSTRYSYKLDGFDKDWSQWRKESKAVYTNLPEGQYFFRVKAKNIYGHESTEAVYEFTLLSPWYRTIWAYVSYVLLLIGVVYGAITFSTRGLKAIIKEHTAEIVKQRDEIGLKNKDITDSINYAKRIQEAILPAREYFNTLLPQGFILFKPKDIVSGDFYWLTGKNNLALVAAVDCTGHGVPGAFMSMIGNALLNEIVNEKSITVPSEILEHLREGVIKALRQSGKEGESKDGMDISLCTVDFDGKELQYAGAYNPLWIVRGENGRTREMIEIKADKFPIGISDNNNYFTNHRIPLQKGDSVYLSSDGFADQFGGKEGKKFMRKNLKTLFMEMASLPMQEQEKTLLKKFDEWKGHYSQVDDVLVIGFRI